MTPPEWAEWEEAQARRKLRRWAGIAVVIAIVILIALAFGSARIN